jgi:hypothetical protein
VVHNRYGRLPGGQLFHTSLRHDLQAVECMPVGFPRQTLRWACISHKIHICVKHILGINTEIGSVCACGCDHVWDVHTWEVISLSDLLWVGSLSACPVHSRLQLLQP